MVNVIKSSRVDWNYCNVSESIQLHWAGADEILAKPWAQSEGCLSEYVPDSNVSMYVSCKGLV